MNAGVEVEAFKTLTEVAAAVTASASRTAAVVWQQACNEIMSKALTAQRSSVQDLVASSEPADCLGLETCVKCEGCISSQCLVCPACVGATRQTLSRRTRKGHVEVP